MELAFYSAFELAKLIREGTLSSSDLLEIYLSRIEKYNKSINAIVTLDIERARARAKHADELRIKGQFLGPLHGVPVTIKDSFETESLKTTSGSPTLADHIPKQNAIAVQRYIDAGAIVFGKTNVPLFCSDHQTHNDVFGVTNNPWDTKRSPSGSSGGAAAALAAGLTALELGSDIAGSIRVPASWTGIYGHKTSYRIVPNVGHIPPPPGTLAEPDLSVIGPLARSAADLMQALDILAGPGAWESTGWTLTLPKPRCAALKQYRVAAWIDDAALPVDTKVKDRLQAVLDKLGAAGVKVDDRARPDIDTAQAFRTYQSLLFSAVGAGFPSSVYETFKQLAQTEDQESEMGKFVRDATLAHRRWLSASAKRALYRAKWAEFFKKYDVLICPVASVPAICHDINTPQIQRIVTVNNKPEPYSILERWVGIITLVYLPATSAPIGRTKEGLPIGVQIVGPFLEDRTTIDFADKLSQLIGGFEPPPGY